MKTKTISAFSTPGLLRLYRSPILWGELTRFLRSKKSFLTLLLFLCGLLFIVYQNWGAFTSHWAPDQNQALGGREFFLSLSFGHLLIITLVTPFLLAPAISEERENDTLEMLFSSPISVRHILVAKMFSPLIFMFLLLFSAIPVLSLCFLSGGLDMGEVARTYIIMLTATLTYGSLGIFCSTLRSRVYEVYLISAGLLLFFSFVIPYHGSIWKYMDSFRWYDTSDYNHGFQVISPFFALRNELNPLPENQGQLSIIPDFIRLIRTGEMHFFSYTLGTYIITSFLIITGFLWGASTQIRRLARGVELTPEQKQQINLIFKIVITLLILSLFGLWFRILMTLEFTQAVIFVMSTLGLAFLVYISASMFGILSGGDEPHEHERDEDFSFDVTTEEGNPGMMLEQRVQWFARMTTLIRLCYLSLMISIFTLPLASYSGSWLFLALPFVSAAMFTLPLSATSISSDRERGLLDLLRTTMLSSQQIIQAKFWTNLQYSLFIALALYLPGMSLQLICGSLGYEVDMFTNSFSMVAILAYPVVLFFSMLLYTAFGLFCSAYTGRTNRALILSGSVILLTLVVPFLVPVPNLMPNSIFAYFGSLGFALLSPLVGVASLYPKDSISIAGRSMITFGGESVYFPMLFVTVQCVLCVIGSYIFLEMAQKKLESIE